MDICRTREISQIKKESAWEREKETDGRASRACSSSPSFNNGWWQLTMWTWSGSRRGRVRKLQRQWPRSTALCVGWTNPGILYLLTSCYKKKNKSKAIKPLLGAIFFLAKSIPDDVLSQVIFAFFFFFPYFVPLLTPACTNLMDVRLATAKGPHDHQERLEGNDQSFTDPQPKLRPGSYFSIPSPIN